jgi:uncharacterized protein
MREKCFSILPIVCFLIAFLFLPVHASAEEEVRTIAADVDAVEEEVNTISAEIDSSEFYIMDTAALFTEQEKSDLISACQDVYETHDTHITIITTTSIGDVSRQVFLEDVYDGLLASFSFPATALILVNMDPNDRGVEIQGYGTAKERLNGNTIESILDDIVPILSDGNYFKAMERFIRLVERTYSAPFYLQTWFSLVIALLIAGIAVYFMAHHSGGRFTVNESTYMDAGNSKLLSRHDSYIRTTLTKRRKPKNNSSGGNLGKGGGTSRGGHSHSGGGRKF